MGFKHFNIRLAIRIVLLLGNMILIASIFGDKRLFFNQIILVIVLIIQTIDLIRFIHATNKELTRFFMAIKHADFSVTFKHSELGTSFKQLQESMTTLIDAHRQVKIEKEAQFQFLQMLVRQLQIGLIALEGDRLTLINPTAESILGIKDTPNWKLVKELQPAFFDTIGNLGDHGKQLLEFKTASDTRFLSVDVSTMTILDRTIKVITIQDINSEIEQKEIEAWHKLIRILTHEIMNSVTPIASLTETMQSLLEYKNGDQKKLQDLSDEVITDIRFSLRTIQKRSDGLLHFIENYRKLTRVPKPTMEKLNVLNFYRGIEQLMKHDLTQKNISFHISAHQDLFLHADPVLLEQVLINLITNGIHAVEGRPNASIQLKAHATQPQIQLEVYDNGKGISDKELTEIFTPFFSTRKDGSGIGLSLSKQIISAHGGSIKAKSEVNVGTSILISLKRV